MTACAFAEDFPATRRAVKQTVGSTIACQLDPQTVHGRHTSEGDTAACTHHSDVGNRAGGHLTDRGWGGAPCRNLAVGSSIPCKTRVPAMAAKTELPAAWTSILGRKEQIQPRTLDASSLNGTGVPLLSPLSRSSHDVRCDTGLPESVSLWYTDSLRRPYFRPACARSGRDPRTVSSRCTPGHTRWNQ